MGIGQAVGTLAGVGLNAALSKKKSKVNTEGIDRERDRQIREIVVADDDRRRKRLRDVRRELAEQRARAAQSGTGGREGSQGAARRGLRNIAIQDDARDRRLRDLDIRHTMERAADRKRGTLLDAQQRTQRSIVGGITSIGKSLLDF